MGNASSAEPSSGDMAEEAQDGFDISPMHDGAFGGQNFSRPMFSKANRSPSVLARRDTIPAEAMANAAAAATAGAEVPAPGTGVDDTTPPAAPNAPQPGPGSGGLSRADFFKNKKGVTKDK